MFPDYLSISYDYGLIEQLVTGPPWKIISKEKHIVNMSAHYHNLLSFLKLSADEASAFTKGNKTASIGNNFQSIDCSKQTDATQVNTTNVDTEWNFRIFDRLMKLKANALDIVNESIIFNKKKTGK